MCILRSYRFTLLPALLLALAACVEERDPRVVLEESQKAVLAVRSAAYVAVFTRQYAEGPIRHNIRATAVVARYGAGSMNELGAKVRMEVQREGRLRTYAYDGNTLRLLNPETKSLTVAGPGTDGVRFITGNVIGSIVQTPFTEAQPFAKALHEADSLTFEGHADVNGARCYIIGVWLPDDEISSDNVEHWYIGVDDYLPRKYIDWYTYDGLRTQSILELADLSVNINPADTVFAPLLPRGYSEEHYRKNRKPGPEIGSKAPDFRLATTRGDSVGPALLRGKPVLLDFWGTWCAPCRKAMPMLQELHRTYHAKGLRVIGISCREPNGADPAGFMQHLGYDYTIAVQGDSVAQMYGVHAFPTVFLLDSAGTVVYTGSGTATGVEDSLHTWLRKCLPLRHPDNSL